jgi:hypothetical protein
MGKRRKMGGASGVVFMPENIGDAIFDMVENRAAV